MILFVGFVLAAYLFYKWVTANTKYFEEKGVTYAEQDLLKTIAVMSSKRMSLADIVQLSYGQFKDKISGRFQFRSPTYFIRDPKLAKQLAVKDFDHFMDHKPILDENIDKMFGKSLISLRGQKWKDMRATLSPMFTGSKMRMMFDYVADIGKQTAGTMKDQIKGGAESEFEFKALAMKFTVDVIASCAFGIEVNSFKNPDNEFAKIAHFVTDFTNVKTALKFLGYIIAAPIMKFFEVRIFTKEIEDFFRAAVIDTMKIRDEKGIVRHDIINLLMQVRKGKLSHEIKEEKVTEGFATVEESQMGKSQVKRSWSDDELAAQCFLFFFAGFDTIASTMSFMAHEVAANPDIQDKLLSEILSMESELDGKTISYEQLQGLKYLDQVVCETLRKWPVSPMIDRICVKDYDLEVDGNRFTIEKDKSIFIPVFAYHRDPNYFPEPDKFDPERFSDENRHKIDPDTYLPFGIGPRNCIGSRFALMELKTIFYYLLLNFSIEVTAKTQIPLVLAKSLVSVKAENGVWVGLKPRE